MLHPQNEDYHAIVFTPHKRFQYSILMQQVESCDSAFSQERNKRFFFLIQQYY